MKRMIFKARTQMIRRTQNAERKAHKGPLVSSMFHAVFARRAVAV